MASCIEGEEATNNIISKAMQQCSPTSLPNIYALLKLFTRIVHALVNGLHLLFDGLTVI